MASGFRAEHLRGFSVPGQPGFVWLYEKKKAAFSDEPVPVHQVETSSAVRVPGI